MLKRYLVSSLIWAFVMFFCSLPALAVTIVDTAWVRTYDGTVSPNDKSNAAITVDGSGNVFVAGSSNGYIVTLKYYPDGDTAWVRTYLGASRASACGVELDGYGNVYVSGTIWYSDWPGTFWYYHITIKYSPDGDTVWARRYNELSSSPISDMTVDRFGNVYITESINNAYLTIKYYPEGDTAWIRTYNGNGWNQACAIAVDGSGSVCVTGASSGIGGYYDYATIKYYFNGSTAWIRRYNAQGDPSFNYPVDLVVDDSGNVYCTVSEHLREIFSNRC